MSTINNASSASRNIPVVSVEAAVKDLAKLYVSVINNKLPLNSIPAPFLWGPPGVGKSDGVFQIGQTIEKETGKKVNITDVRLLLFSPVDLRGVPVADAEHQFADWLMPRIFDMDSSEDVVNILFLDELSAAPQSVQAAAYQITLNRAIGEHKLPANTIVIAAGNRTTDRSVAFRMPNALANRLMHMEVMVDFDSWRNWAINNNINKYVLGYLTFDSSKLICEEVSLDDVAFQTPRSWMYVSNIINSMLVGVSDTRQEIAIIESLYNAICACIGKGIAMEFLAWCKVNGDLPNVNEIVAGLNPAYPKGQDTLYALISALTTCLIKKAENRTVSVTEIDNVCTYAEKFPTDFSVMLYKNLITNDALKVKLLKSSGFMSFIKKNQKYVASLGINLK